MGIYVIIGIPLIGILFALLIHSSNSLENLRLIDLVIQDKWYSFH